MIAWLPRTSMCAGRCLPLILLTSTGFNEAREAPWPIADRTARQDFRTQFRP